MHCRATFWFAVVLLGLANTAQLPAQPKAGDWPVFRGNAAQTGVADAALPDQLAVKWTFKAQDSVEATPVIVNQTVYIGAMNGKLYALDLATGKKKWEYQAGPIKAAAAVLGNVVYVGDLKGVLHGVDLGSGKKRFTVTTDAEIASPANFFKGLIVFGSYDHNLYCVTNEGRVVWICETKEKVHGAPAVVGDHILVAGCDQMLHVVDAVKGQHVKTVPLGGQVAASVAVRGDQLYVGAMTNQMLAIDWKNGDVLWKFEAKRFAQPFYSSPAVTDDLVVAGSRDKLVHAWNRQTGKVAWTFPTKGRVDSSPVIAGQRVVVGSLDGHLYMLDLARGTEVSRFDLGAIAGSPAVGGQCIVVGTVQGDVVCLAAKK